MMKSDKDFIKHYLITALWSSTDESNEQGGDPMDANYSIEDIDLATLKSSVKDCLAFINQCEDKELTDEWDYSTAGHDFWLTRNRHGAGFWDGDYPKHGDDLTDISQEFGEVYLYITDNQRISA